MTKEPVPSAVSSVSHVRDFSLTARDVADMFGVDPKTVTRWVTDGKMKGRVRVIRTMGGHRRYSLSDIERLLAEDDYLDGAPLDDIVPDSTEVTPLTAAPDAEVDSVTAA